MVRSSGVPDKGARPGAVTVWLLISLVVILSIVAIGMDGGRMMEKRRHVQATADAAALAAASQLYQLDVSQPGDANASGLRSNAATDGAVNLASANGFSNDGSTSTVIVNTPPLSGAFAGQRDYAEIIVQYNLPGSFSAIFTQNTLPIKARAVAVGRAMELGLIVLRQTGSGAFFSDSKGTLTLVNGRIYVNSNDASAFVQTNSGNIIADASYVTGNYSQSSSASFTGRMRTGVRRTPDPLRLLRVPNPADYTVQSNARLTVNSSNPITLLPGLYQGGIKIEGSSNVVLSSGVYIMQGGGFQVSDQAIVTGSEVLIYNTTGSSPAGQIDIDTDGKFDLSAPRSGTYQGVSIFQDRSLTQTLSITGNGSTTLGGTVYAASAAVSLAGHAQGNTTDTLGGAYICSSFLVWGSGNIKIDSGGNAPPVPEILLVE